MADFVIAPGNPPPELAEIVWYNGPDGRRLRSMYAPTLSKFKRSRGTVIVCPGRTEFIEKYFEVVRDLQTRGFCAVVFDWPGQGRSDRDLKDPLAGYVESFDIFTEALQLGMTALATRIQSPQVILAHSMGGAIALEAMRTGVISPQAAAFSAPMWGLRLPSLASFFINVQCMIGQGRSTVTRHKSEQRFADDSLTHDQKRWEMVQQLEELDPRLALKSVTWRWVKSALDVTSKFSKENALDDLTIPMLVVSAEHETLVDNEAHSTIAQRLLNCQHVTINGARHEILVEADAIRSVFWDHFDALLLKSDI